MTSRQLGAIRDRRIVDLVACLGFALPEHVARVVCRGRVDIARRRLLQLTRLGLLERLEIARNAPYVYHAPGRRPAGARVQHALATAGIYCALAATPAQSCALRAWLPEYDAGADYRADALLLATVATRPAAIFLEVDMGSERVPVVARKVEMLAAYRDAGGHRSSTWWSPDVHVAQLVAAPRERAEQVRTPLQEVAARLGLIVGVVNVAELESQPWAVLKRLLSVQVTGQGTRAPLPQQPGAPRLYVPGQRLHSGGTGSDGGYPEVRDTPSDRPGSPLGATAGQIMGGVR